MSEMEMKEHRSIRSESSGESGGSKVKDEIKKRKDSMKAKPVVRQWFITVNGQQVNTASFVERHPSWLELIFDLAVVIAIQKLGHDFSANIEEHDKREIAPIIFFLKFIPIISIWMYLDAYLNRFGQLESLADTVLVFCQFVIIALVSMVVEAATGTTNESLEERSVSEFALGIAISQAIFIVAGLRVALIIEETRTFNLIWSIPLAIGLVIWLIVAFVPMTLTEKYIIIGVANAFELWRFAIMSVAIQYVKSKNMSYTYIPVNVPLQGERYGLLTVIAIGEVIAVIFGENLKPRTYGATIMAIVQGFLFKFAYFDIFDCTGERAEKHALRQSRQNGILYYLFHYLIVAGIVVASMFLATKPHESGRRLATDEVHEEEDNVIYRQTIFAVSVSVVLLCTHLLGKTHQRMAEHEDMKLIPSYISTIVVVLASVLICLISSLIEFRDHLACQGYVLIIFGFTLFLEFIFTWHLLDWEKENTFINSRESETISTQSSTDNLDTSEPGGLSYSDFSHETLSNGGGSEEKVTTEKQEPGPRVHNPQCAAILRSKMGMLRLRTPSCKNLIAERIKHRCGHKHHNGHHTVHPENDEYHHDDHPVENGIEAETATNNNTIESKNFDLKMTENFQDKI